MCTLTLMSWLGWSAPVQRMPELCDPLSIAKRPLSAASVHVQCRNERLAPYDRHSHKTNAIADNLAIAMPAGKLSAPR